MGGVLSFGGESLVLWMEKSCPLVGKSLVLWWGNYCPVVGKYCPVVGKSRPAVRKALSYDYIFFIYSLCVFLIYSL